MRKRDDDFDWDEYDDVEGDFDIDDETRPGVLRRVFGSRPLDRVATVVALVAVVTVFSNALWFQPGPHPAPIFAVVPAKPETITGSVPPPPAVTVRPELVRAVQKELLRRGFYDGTIDGLMGQETVLAIRNAEVGLGAKESGLPSDLLLARLRTLGASKRSEPAAPARSDDPIALMLRGQR